MTLRREKIVHMGTSFSRDPDQAGSFKCLEIG